MATISYKCSVCKREIEILENTKGLSVFAKCIVTQGCRGKLHKTSRNPNNIRESFPSPVPTLDDFTPRGTLYEHTQDILSTVWKIKHSLGVSPAVDVFIRDELGVHTILAPDSYEFRFIDKNTVHIIFAQPSRGKVHCIARSSVPKTALPLVDSSQLFQVTVGGTFTFAIPKLLTKFNGVPTVTPTPTLPLDLESATPDDIQIEISVQKPNEEEVICFETLPSLQSTSPWSGWTEILIRKRRHSYVRMKNILNFRIFDDSNLSFDDIPNGTIIKFLRINYGTGIWEVIPSRGLFMLLANKPFGAIDKVKDKLIDVGELITLVDTGNPENNDVIAFSYYDGEVFIDNANLETTYPPIERVS